MISGTRVSLRHVAIGDLTSLLEMCNDMESRGAFTRSRLRSPFDFHKEFAENGFASEAFEMLLIIDAGNNVIGNLVHFTTRTYSDAREIGYQIFRSASRNQGLATEALALLIDNLFENRTLNRLEVVMDCRNIASERIAIKAGFKREGTLRGHVFLRGEHSDSYLYAMVRSDWQRVRQRPGDQGVS